MGFESIVFGASPSSCLSIIDNVQSSSSKTCDYDDKIIIRVILVVILPPETKINTYRKRQACRFLVYHLRRYAAALDCFLCFLSTQCCKHTEDSKIADNNNVACEVGLVEEELMSLDKNTLTRLEDVSVKRLASLVRYSLLGCIEKLNYSQYVSKTEEKYHENNYYNQALSPINRKTQEESTHRYTGEEQKSLFFPGEHDVVIIESVLLRNASCPGVWDAEKDSLWDVFTPPPLGYTSKALTTSSTNSIARDEKWLTVLAESVSSLTGSVGIADTVIASATVKDSSMTRLKSSQKCGKNMVSPSVTKIKRKHLVSCTKDNKDVADFFEDLLKK